MSRTATLTFGTWGQLRVTIDGRDVTWFRGVEARVQGWEHTDPYGPSTATVVFPQITVFDDRDTDRNLKWLREGAVVKVQRILNGAVVGRNDPPFYGLIDAIEESDSGVTVSCSGMFNGRLSTRMHQPPQTKRYNVDGGRLIYREANPVRGLNVFPKGGLDTGINVEANGSRDMTKLGFIDEVLGLLVRDNGESVTLLPDTTRGVGSFRLQWRALKADPDATVYAGAPGVQVTLRRDLLDMVSTVYGEGVAPGGERWRNKVSPNMDKTTPEPPYPFHDGRSFGIGTTDADTDTGDSLNVMARELMSDGLLTADEIDHHADTFTADVEDAVQEMQRNLHLTPTGRMTPSLWFKLYNKTFDTKSKRGAYFAPLAQDGRTRHFDRAGDGTPVALNDGYDWHVPVVEQFISYGEGVRKRDARRNARTIVARSAARIGTVTLTTDPAERSRLDLRPGMTLALAQMHGTSLRLYVSQVAVDWSSETRPVTCTVSTTPRHWLDLATILERNRDARKSPAHKAAHQRRRSAQVSDALHGWEGEAGSGMMPHRKLQGGRWNVFSMDAAERGVMREIAYNVDPNVEFFLGVFADKVHEGVLQRRLGNPGEWVGGGTNRESVWQANASWLIDEERKLIEGWGNPHNPCGYYPHHHHNEDGYTDHPVTGKLRDRASWHFNSDSGRLWVAVWPTEDCTGYGRARIQIHEGT